MCVIAVKDKGIKWLDHKSMKRCFDTNPDGGGLAWYDGKKLWVKKGYFRWKEMWKDMQDFEDYPVIAHFRIATHGKVEYKNCHPFLLANNIALAHNGMIAGSVVKPDENQTDSQKFGQEYLEPFSMTQCITNKTLHRMWEHMIGSGNKMALMDTSGRIVILNKQAGEEHEGMWFSNGSYKEYKYARYDYDDWGGYGGRWNGSYYSGYYNGLDKLPKNNCLTDATHGFKDEDIGSLAQTDEDFERETLNGMGYNIDKKTRKCDWSYEGICECEESDKQYATECHGFYPLCKHYQLPIDYDEEEEVVKTIMDSMAQDKATKKLSGYCKLYDRKSNKCTIGAPNCNACWGYKEDCKLYQNSSKNAIVPATKGKCAHAMDWGKCKLALMVKGFHCSGFNGACVSYTDRLAIQPTDTPEQAAQKQKVIDIMSMPKGDEKTLAMIKWDKEGSKSTHIVPALKRGTA